MIRLEQARMNARLTVEQLAAATGVSARTIRNLEAGRGARDTTVFALADRLNVTPSELLRRVDDMPEEVAA